MMSSASLPSSRVGSTPPSISVIVRSMDRPSLGAALASVAAQALPGVEVVLVNALGTLHGPVPEQAGAHPLRFVQAGRPLPRSAAANAGLDAALGTRVIFLDDDDVYLDGHLARLSAALDQAPAAVAAYADVAMGQEADGRWQEQHRFAADFDPMRLRFENFLPLHAVLVDRSRADARRCRFDEALDLFEDWDWWLQLARQGPFVHVPGVSARYAVDSELGSGVFDRSETAAKARDKLLLKWAARDTPSDRVALLEALQQEYRAHHQAMARAALAARAEDDLRAIVRAREQELQEGSTQRADLNTLVKARDQEITRFDEQVRDLHLHLANKVTELTAAQAELASSRAELMAARAELEQMRREKPLQALKRILRPASPRR